jgi:DNA-binding transcriptional ArsR family regulator
MKQPSHAARTKRFADRFSAIGAEPRLRIMQYLVAAPQGQKTVGEIQEEMRIPWSTLSHHLEKLRNERLVTTRREGSFLWYKANGKVLDEMLVFLSLDCDILTSRSKSQTS